jgi:hypothetical protein
MDLNIGKMPHIKPQHSLMLLSTASIALGVLTISLFFIRYPMYALAVMIADAFILVFHGILTLAGIKASKSSNGITTNDAVMDMAKGILNNPESLNAIAGNLIKPPVVKCKICNEPMVCTKQEGLKFTYYCAKDNRTVNYEAPIDINSALNMLKGDKNADKS